LNGGEGESEDNSECPKAELEKRGAWSVEGGGWRVEGREKSDEGREGAGDEGDEGGLGVAGGELEGDEQ